MLLLVLRVPGRLEPGQRRRQVLFLVRAGGCEAGLGRPPGTHKYLLQQCLARGAASARLGYVRRILLQPEELGKRRGADSGPAVRQGLADHQRPEHPFGGGGLRPVFVFLHHPAAAEGSEGDCAGAAPGHLQKRLEQRLRLSYSGDKEKEEGVQALVDSFCVL